MNWDQVEGNWKEFKGKVKQKWGRLTDDDIDVIRGRREELEGALQRTYGKTKEEIRREVDEFCSACERG